jgi:hypothetical protein
VVGEYQVDEAEHETHLPRNLERPNDVFVGRAKQGKESRGGRRDPRIHAEAANDGAQQPGDDEMKHDDRELIWEVRAHAEYVEQCAVEEDRQCGPMLLVRPEEVSEARGVTTGKEDPLVEPEPLRAAMDVEQHERRKQDDYEAIQCGALGGAAWSCLVGSA